MKISSILFLFILISCNPVNEDKKELNYQEGYLYNAYQLENKVFDYFIFWDGHGDTETIILKSDKITFEATPSYPIPFMLDRVEHVELKITDKYGSATEQGTLEFKENGIVITYLDQEKFFLQLKNHN